ncbi:MAG: hypothetical protein FWE16_01555 [Firmicutes bacterium]|nr:hypothetical protein [Bacillota bacterium]
MESLKDELGKLPKNKEGFIETSTLRSNKKLYAHVKYSARKNGTTVKKFIESLGFKYDGVTQLTEDELVIELSKEFDKNIPIRTNDFRNSELFDIVKNRAHRRGLGIKKMLESYGFEYDGNDEPVRKKDLISLISQYADKDNVLRNLPDSVLDKLKNAANTAFTGTVQNFLLQNTEYVLEGEQRELGDYISETQRMLDAEFRPNGEEGIIDISGLPSKNPRLYQRIIHIRDQLFGDSIETVEDTIINHFLNYSYSGKSKERSMMPKNELIVNLTAHHNKERMFTRSELNQLHFYAGLYARKKQITTRELYESYGLFGKHSHTYFHGLTREKKDRSND